MRTNAFKTHIKYFHLNIDFQTHAFFKQLDWVMIQTKIEKIKWSYQIDLHALVMMDSHLHILISSHQQKENFFTDHLRNELKIDQNQESYSEPISNHAQYLNTYKYIYRNPVEAGLCQSVETYEFSSLHFIMGRSIPYCQVTDQLGLVQNPFHLLNWLNTSKNYKISQLKSLRQDNSFSI